MSASPQRALVQLTLSEDLLGSAEPAAWIGPLVALGTRASRYAARLNDRQLIVAISVPRRDYAAALIGCGWMMASAAAMLDPPLETMRRLARGTPVRVVTEREVLTGHFSALDEDRTPPRLHLEESRWQADKIRALSPLLSLDAAERQERPEAGSAGALARLTDSWDARLCVPPQDLAIVGTLTWMQSDLDVFLARDGDDGYVPTKLSSLVLPRYKRAATWSTRLYASATLAEKLPLPAEIRAVVLDGTGAVKYLTEIDAPIVIVVLDRSVTDEAASEICVQARNTRGEPVSLTADLGWRPPAGIEALAFTVPL